MHPWSLELHPILERFRALVPGLSRSDEKLYHIFLSPPFALPRDAHQTPLKYLFIATQSSPTTLRQFADPSFELTLSGTRVLPAKSSKFSKSFKEIEILLTERCSSADGLCYSIHETVTDLYNCVQPPPIVRRILNVYLNGDQALKFLQEESTNPALKRAWANLDRQWRVLEITDATLQDAIEKVKQVTDEIAELVFAIPIIQAMPIAIRSKLNYAIFNAVTTKVHYKLLAAYHHAYDAQNRKAQRAVRESNPAQLSEKFDPDGLFVALNYLKSGILHMPTTVDAIICVTKFFDGVIAAMKAPGNEIAADDLLPAIILAMGQDSGFCSHAFSFFQYLVDIWPQAGLDDRVTYVLVTCSIAATHLARMEERPALPTPMEIAAEEEKNAETIELLEDLLANL
jgi:hypothetical protein